MVFGVAEVFRTHARCDLAISLIIALLLPSAAGAQTDVRAYPDPGYRRLGVYAGGPDSYFDYRLSKLSLGDTFPNKKAYWASLKADEQRLTSPHRHDIYCVYCGERSDSLESVKSRVDAWLKPEADTPTYPELIPAICLGEENVPNRDTVLDGLANHIRETYGIPVFQFYSMPLSPNPDLTADGWVLDAYGMQDVRFRKHLMKFVALGKPVICIPWASDPHWTGWSRSENTAAMIDREWHQFPICMEFDVSCAAFAVAGPGAMNPWLNSTTKHMIKLRNWLRLKREQMHVFNDGDLPLPMANFSARDRSISVGGDPDSPSVYEENFSGFGWIHDADLRGFLNLQLTSKPEQPGFLRMSPQSGQAVNASLTWRFDSYFPLERVRVTLDAAAPSVAGCRNTLSITTDELGDEWPLCVEQVDANEMGTVVLSVPDSLRGKRVFYVRLNMENEAESDHVAANQIDRLRVECVHQPPSSETAAKLVEDDYGNLTYEDDFSTMRWKHLGRVNVAHATHGGQRADEFWVGMVGGHATSTELTQRVSSSRPLEQLVVTADCYADGKNLGGQAVLQVAPRGAKPKWQAGTQGRHQGALRVEIPPSELGDLQEFDVRVVLRSSSGVEQGAKACATLQALKVEGRRRRTRE
jgi:hypothetical protein